MCQDGKLNNHVQRETGRLVNEHPQKYNYEISDQLNLQFSQSSSRDNTVFSDETNLTEVSSVKTCNDGCGTLESDNSQTSEPTRPIKDRCQGTITRVGIETANLTNKNTDCRESGPDTSLSLENETGKHIAEDCQFPSTEPDSELPQQPTSLEYFTHSNQDNRDQYQAKERCREDAPVTQTNEAFGTHLPETSTAGSDNQEEITCEDRKFDAVWKEISKLRSVVHELSRNSTPNRRAVQNRSEVNRHAADTPILSDLEPTLPRLRSTRSTQTPTRKRRLTSPDLVSKLRRQ